jgi:uncharacterized protein YqkB
MQYGYTDAVKISAWLIDFSACGCQVYGVQYVWVVMKLKRAMLLIHSVINNTVLLILLWPYPTILGPAIP